MADYDNTNQIILTKAVSDKPNAPDLRVNFNVDGVKYKAGLWVWTKKDGTPVTDKNGNRQYKGKVELDDYEPGAKAESKPEPEFGDQDIPF